ncbi:hypothetical protein L2D00_11025 [Hyphomonadaceae bacterium BL14]|nr:hypothetical protein L2D00_11025 [Hyphomonadaceae bacterium BL14]
MNSHEEYTYIIHTNPNIIYTMVGAYERHDEIVRDMLVILSDIKAKRISGMIIDFRKVNNPLDHYEHIDLANRTRLFFNDYTPTGWITDAAGAGHAGDMVRLLRDRGMNTRMFTSWAVLTKWLGCPRAADPSIKDTLEL